MAVFNAEGLYYKELNEEVRECPDSFIEIENVMGQRYIGAGATDKRFLIHGIPGNALGALLDGATIEVDDNAQDAVGDTMNDGRIIVRGSVGDACGYAMRGGKIYIKGKAGYRAGIHMKAYHEKQPLLIIGENAGSFLGEYLAGGTIIVLGLKQKGKAPVGYFCGTGMHGGRIYLRCDEAPFDLPPQVSCRDAGEEEKADIAEKISEYCRLFGLCAEKLLEEHFFTLEPNSANPYKQLYTNV